VTLPVDLTQVSSSSVTDDGFEVTDVSNADPAGAMRTVWWSSDGSTWQKRADLPAPIAPANRHFTGRVQANAWIPVEGSATGLSLDDIDLALGVKEDGGQCATVSSACNRTVLRAESRSGTLVLSRGRDARNHVYWSPDGRAWATAPLDEVTSLGSEWMVESVHADDAGSFLIVASKSTARGLDRTLEVRMFHATVA
jgi:hypothetical protein